MRTINLSSNDIDYFKYSILTSLHYNDISNNPQRISNLNKYESQYDFSHIKPIQFERNNPNISLSIYNTQNEQIYSSINNSQNKANIIQINNRYAAIKSHKNKLNELLKSFIHIEFKKFILNKIILDYSRFIPLTSSHCFHLLSLKRIKQSSSSSYGITSNLLL